MKRKLLSLSLLAFASTLASWGQLYRPTNVMTTLPESGKTYMIYNAFTQNSEEGGSRIDNRNWFVGVNEISNSLMVDATHTLPSEFKGNNAYLFEIGMEGDNYAFKSVLTGGYVKSASLNEDISGWSLTDATTGDTRYSDLENVWLIENVTDGLSTPFWNGNAVSFAMWTNGHPYQFWEFEQLPAWKVTYECYNQYDELILTKVVDVEQGTSYGPTAPNIALYNYVSMSTDTATVEWQSDLTIKVNYEENFPFKTTVIAEGATDFPSDANWHLMTIASAKYYLSYTEGQSYIPVSASTLDNVTDNDLWCYTGNPSDGFKIYNKAAGPTMILSSAINHSEDANTGAYTYPLLTEIEQLVEIIITMWDIFTV